MNVNFEYHKVTASKTLEDFTLKKLGKLVNKYTIINGIDVYFDTENTTSRDTGMKCSIRVFVSNTECFAQSSKDTFQKAVLEVIDDLNTQLVKKKEKMMKHSIVKLI